MKGSYRSVNSQIIASFPTTFPRVRYVPEVKGAGMKKLVGVNDKGLRVGEDHQNAKLTNEEVERIRELHEGGMTYDVLAEKFDVSKSAVAMICRYERRAETAAAWKSVHVPDQ